MADLLLRVEGDVIVSVVWSVSSLLSSSESGSRPPIEDLEKLEEAPRRVSTAVDIAAWRRSEEGRVGSVKRETGSVEGL